MFVGKSPSTSRTKKKPVASVSAQSNEAITRIPRAKVEVPELDEPQGHGTDDQNVLDEQIAKLNSDQKRVFDNVIEKIETYIKEMKSDDPSQNKRRLPKEPLRQFVSGVGGTGKSFLINVIRLYIKEKFQREVKVAAPTGVAAFNIDGVTVHNLLRLPVINANKSIQYFPLAKKHLKELKTSMQNVDLIIIDEVSMISNTMFLIIHQRLCEIFDIRNTEEDCYFGRINILFFGDLLQLPPVKAISPFIDFPPIMGIETNLWKTLLTYDELTINMRQESDKNFAQILHNIRIGKLSETDEKVLRKREIILADKEPVEECLQSLITYIKERPQNTMCIFATRARCKAINDAMLEKIGSKSIKLKCEDKIIANTDKDENKAKHLLKRYRLKIIDDIGLEDEIEVKQGARVMLMRNIDTKNGLVNGATGVLREIQMDDETPTLSIQFDSIGEHQIKQIKGIHGLFPGVYMTRCQFPVCLAWAITIHKSQGLTKDSCILDIGESIFTEGQAYVALSRVKTLDGLHIVNLDPSKIAAQRDAIVEYKRLRKMCKQEFDMIEENTAPNRYIADQNLYVYTIKKKRGLDLSQIQPSLNLKRHRKNSEENIDGTA